MRQYKYKALWLTLVFCLSTGCEPLLLADLLITAPAGASLAIDPVAFAELSAEEMARLRGQQPQEGPQIELRSPKNHAVFMGNESIPVHLEFLPAADGVEPDMATIEVEVRKGWFGQDITNRVAQYVKGTAVRVPSVDFQGYTGDFQFLIRIRDRQGRLSEERFNVTIEA